MEGGRKKEFEMVIKLFFIDTAVKPVSCAGGREQTREERRGGSKQGREQAREGVSERMSEGERERVSEGGREGWMSLNRPS